MKLQTLLLILTMVFNTLYADEIKLDSVMVTANKMEQNILDVPQTITVMDEATIQEKGIDSIPKVIDEIPNMNIIDAKGFGTTMNFRGLNTSLFTNSNPIVLYVDGVPITDKQSYKATLVNIKRIEVLRGPQGTLYGKDAIGGVINIVTNDTPEALNGYINVEYGDNDFTKTNFNISMPLISQKLFAGISGEFKKDDGWITNEYNSDDNAEKSEKKNINLYVKYQPTQRASFKINASRTKLEDYWIEGGAFSSTVDIKDIKRDDVEHVTFDVPTIEKKRIDSQSLAFNYVFDRFNLDWIVTHLDVDMDGTYDTDYRNDIKNKGLSQFNYNDTRTYSNEIRLSNNDGDFKWVTGIYYDNEKKEQDPLGYDQYYFGSTYYASSSSTNKSETKALFGQLMLPLFENYELTLGGRYQQTKKDIDATTQTQWGATKYPDYNLEADKKWNTFLPKIAFAYKTESMTTFASISKGYMPGGYNYFPTSGSDSDNGFEPQTSINYEVGVKGAYNDLSFSVAIFYMDIKDIHIYKQDGALWLTDNANKAHSQGIELDLNYALNDQFELSTSLGYINAKYDDYDTGTTDFNGQDIENIPSHTANITLTYRNPKGMYGLFSIKNRGNISFYDNTNQEFLQDGSNTIADIKLGYKFSNWDIYGYVNNITDEDYITTFMSKDGLTIATFNEPRFVGIGARYSF